MLYYYYLHNLHHHHHHLVLVLLLIVFPCELLLTHVTTVVAVDLRSGQGSVYEGPPKEGQRANLSLRVEDGHLAALAGGTLTLHDALMSSKLKAFGNLTLTQQLQKLFRFQSNM